MITLQNLGDSILFTFDENDKYLNNGTISVPMNSLILVTDDSEMATFRKSATNDIFVSALYSDFGMTKAELEQWYAENMVSEVTEEDVDEKIAEAVGEETNRAVSAETALSGAIDAVDAAYKAADSVISGAVDNLSTALQNESQRAISAETSLSGAIDSIDSRLTEDEGVIGAGLNALNNSLSGKADISAVTEAINAIDVAYKAADSVISGAVDNLSTALQNESQRAISAETSLSGAIDTKIDESAITSAITSASTDSEIPTAKAVYDALQESGLDEDTEKLISGSLNDLNERKQDTLVSGTNIKTINNESILGSGNIDIQGGGITVDPSLDSGSTNAVANSAITNAINTVSGDSVCNCRDFLTVESGNSEILTVFNTNSGGILPNGIYRRFRMPLYIDAADDNRVKLAINTSITSSSTDAQVPSAKAVYDAIQGGGGSSYTAGDGIDITNDVISVTGKVDTSAITTAITSASTDAQVPSAKAVNDKLGGLSLVKISQAAYDALSPNYDSNTLYIIVNEPPFNGKWKATYFDSTVESAQCDSTSAITKGDVTVENIASFEIGDCVTSIGDELFYIDPDQAPLTSVTFGNNVTSIGHDAFTYCTGLTEVVLPDSVTSIGDSAFSFCSNLRSINIPSGVTSIGTYTFSSDTSLTNINIPSGVTSIAMGAFFSCRSLTSVTIEATTPPTLGRAVFDDTNTNLVIYVPSQSVEAYKTAANWSDYASRIQAIS